MGLYNILQGKYQWFLLNLKCDEFNLSKFVHGLPVHHFDTNLFFIFPIIWHDNELNPKPYLGVPIPFFIRKYEIHFIAKSNN